ncbi:MAG: hypothetical protein ACUVT2_11890 [Thiobacillaceae bacterium]
MRIPSRRDGTSRGLPRPRQAASLLPSKDGCYELTLPYSDNRELVMDILRHVPEVQVLTPAVLRHHVADRLRVGLARLQPAHS